MSDKNMPKKVKSLIQTLSDSNYHSGTVLGNKLQVTRGAVWEIIKQIKKCGINVDAKTNIGYRIHHGLELLDKNKIAEYIKNKHNFDSDSILIFDKLQSTNAYLVELLEAKKNIKSNKLKKCVCFAEYQTAGKGRLGREWVSPFAQNIYMSLLWQFFYEPLKLSCLGLVVAVAVIEALKKYGIKDRLFLKWPNDIWWNKCKLAGILIELSGEAHHIYNAVIGIGLNVNMPKKANKKITQPWCDVAQITSSIPERNKLAGILLNTLLNVITDYQKRGSKPFVKKWRELDVAYGKKVAIITPQQKIFGTGFGIDDKGYFLLKDRYGKIHSFASGEISLRLFKETNGMAP